MVNENAAQVLRRQREVEDIVNHYLLDTDDARYVIVELLILRNEEFSEKTLSLTSAKDLHSLGFPYRFMTSWEKALNCASSSSSGSLFFGSVARRRRDL